MEHLSLHVKNDFKNFHLFVNIGTYEKLTLSVYQVSWASLYIIVQSMHNFYAHVTNVKSYVTRKRTEYKLGNNSISTINIKYLKYFFNEKQVLAKSTSKFLIRLKGSLWKIFCGDKILIFHAHTMSGRNYGIYGSSITKVCGIWTTKVI